MNEDLIIACKMKVILLVSHVYWTWIPLYSIIYLYDIPIQDYIDLDQCLYINICNHLTRCVDMFMYVFVASPHTARERSELK